MKTLSVTKQFDTAVKTSKRVTAVMRMFGLTIDRLEDSRVTHKCSIDVEAGDIVYITGPSGAGKSVLLREFQNAISPDEQVNIEKIRMPSDVASIDCIYGEESTVVKTLLLFSIAGLSDVFCMLTPPAYLSEGQKFRFRLASAIASGKKYVFADEFCSNLDRITAAVIAYNIRRFAKKNGVTFFLASSHDDILADLQPDVLIVKHLSGPAEVTYKTKR